MAIVKSELIKELKKSYPNFLNKDLNKIIEIILKEIKQTLQRGERVELRNFGVFKSKFMKPRYGSDPRNKKKIYIPSKWKVTFKASLNINKKLNEKT